MNQQKSIRSDLNSCDQSRGLDIEPILQRLNGDRELLRELVRIYAEDSPGLLERIRRGVATQNVAMLVQAAHALKGLASNFSTNGVERSAQELEMLGKQQAWDTIPQLMQQVETEMASLEASFASDVWQ